MREVILRNLAECKRCKDIIESTHTHDFVSCTCGAVSVDGGKDYLRRSYDDANNVIERSQVEYHPIAVWLAKKIQNSLGLKSQEKRISYLIHSSLSSEATHHIMGGLNEVPEFAALSFEVRDKIRKTIQRELTGEYK